MIDIESSVVRYVRADEVWPMLCRSSFYPFTPEHENDHPGELGYDVTLDRKIVLLPGESIDWDAMIADGVAAVARSLHIEERVGGLI